MTYKEVEGVDENGNPTTFKIEIPSAKEQLKELKQACENHMGTMVYALQEDRFNLIKQALDEGEKAKEVLGIIKPFLKNLRLEQNEKGEYEVLIDVINSDKPLIIARLKTETEFNLIKEAL